MENTWSEMFAAISKAQPDLQDILDGKK